MMPAPLTIPKRPTFGDWILLPPTLWTEDQRREWEEKNAQFKADVDAYVAELPDFIDYLNRIAAKQAGR